MALTATICAHTEDGGLEHGYFWIHLEGLPLLFAADGMQPAVVEINDGNFTRVEGGRMTDAGQLLYARLAPRFHQILSHDPQQSLRLQMFGYPDKVGRGQITMSIECVRRILSEQFPAIRFGNYLPALT
jgi:hypothetical protein